MYFRAVSINIDLSQKLHSVLACAFKQSGLFYILLIDRFPLNLLIQFI